MTELISPLFTTNCVNETIELGTRNATLLVDEKPYNIVASAELRFRPSDQVIIKVELPLDRSGIHKAIYAESFSIQFDGQNEPMRVIPIERTATEKCAQLKLLPQISKIWLHGSKHEKLTKGILHLLNFRNFYSQDKSPDGDIIAKIGGTSQRIGRALLRSNNWEIEIQSVPNLPNMEKQIKIQGGHAITHVVEITNSLAPFTIGELTRLVNQLRLFLSFARGQWTSPFGVYGWENDKLVLEDWSMTLSAPWSSARSWLDIHHGNCLGELFPGFIRAIEAPVTGRVIKNSLYWYLRSNRGGEGAGIDSGIILTQAALERLSYSILTSRGLDIPRRAADKIRAALNTLGLSTSIPEASKDLHRVALNGKVSDGPHAITKVRNELIHPESGDTGDIRNAMYDLWNLSQWYYELMVLKLSDYAGDYSNRLESKWVGEVDKVPWAQSGNSSSSTGTRSGKSTR
jgi:hypothetical protein